jgi:Tfp pilus assembly PilM family ATPase
MQHAKDDERPIGAIADLGWNSGTFVIAHGTEIRYQQPLEAAGMAAAHAAIIDRFGLGDEISEGLLGEVYADFASSQTAPESVHAAWTRSLLMRRAGELATELMALLVHARERYPIRLTRLLLTGGGAQSRGLDTFLAARLGVEVVICRPTSLIICNGTPQILAQSPALVQAIGLARWEG